MPLVCCCVDLYAQTVDSTKTYHIEEVSVSAQRIRKEVIPVQMLAGEELQKLVSILWLMQSAIFPESR